MRILILLIFLHYQKIFGLKHNCDYPSDIPPLSEDFWVKAQLRLPEDIVTVKVEIDPETFAWFQSQGETTPEQMSVALKIYAQANKAFSSSITKAG